MAYNALVMEARDDHYQSDFANKHYGCGRGEGRRKRIQALCEARDMELNDGRRSAPDAASTAKLEQIMDELSSSRSWPTSL